jgi:hypothetical protein
VRRTAAAGRLAGCRSLLRWQRPPELRTPMGTAAGSRNKSADGSVATVARESVWRKAMRAKRERSQRAPARFARMRRCLILRQGASPLRPPAPFPWSIDCTRVSKSVKGSLRRHKTPPLTDSLTRQRDLLTRGKGGLCTGGRGGAVPPPVGRPRAIGVWRPAARFARMRRRLILRQGAGPLRPPWGALTATGLLMEAATVRAANARGSATPPC